MEFGGTTNFGGTWKRIFQDIFARLAMGMRNFDWNPPSGHRGLVDGFKLEKIFDDI
jgi:hypothetical protein